MIGKYKLKREDVIDGNCLLTYYISLSFPLTSIIMDNIINAVVNKSNEANRNINLNIVGDRDNDNNNILDDNYLIN